MVGSLQTDNEAGIATGLDSITWNETSIRDFQNAINEAAKERSSCADTVVSLPQLVNHVHVLVAMMIAQ